MNRMEALAPMKVLMCRPDYYGIKYEINPWMNIKCQVDHQQALIQWESLCKTIKKCGAEIELVAPIADWPDMVFTANAGLVYQNKIILSHFKFKERQGEIPYFKTWFAKAGFEIKNPEDHYLPPFFEGAGDALSAGDKLFAGYGFRTERKFYENSPYLHYSKLIYCELKDPYFYHLDTCFCPLNDKLAIWYPAAFTEESQKRMAAEIELIPVIEEEAKQFACNAVVLDKQVILPANCPQISAVLQKRGFKVHACEMNEYLKAGGACKCLTLMLD